MNRKTCSGNWMVLANQWKSLICLPRDDHDSPVPCSVHFDGTAGAPTGNGRAFSSVMISLKAKPLNIKPPFASTYPVLKAIVVTHAIISQLLWAFAAMQR